MDIGVLLIVVGSIGLIIGSVTDIKKREVADWLNYFLILSGLGMRFLYSLYTLEWSFFLYGLIGFGAFTALAYAMFLTGQWGGGDSKMLMAMGALFATYPESLHAYFDPEFFGFPFLLAFWINLLIIGAIYGILWTFGIGLFHLRELRGSWKKWMGDYSVRQMRTISHLFALVLLIGGILAANFSGMELLLFGGVAFSLIIVFFFYLFILVKSVEDSCMFRVVKPDQLVEGDWPFDDIKVDDKVVFSKDKKVGIETRDIEMLKRFYRKGKLEKIKIKHGVPFVPSSLFSLIVTLIYGNVLIFLII
ncbi:MAG: prepilin peptidase [Candidatus Woesearchaeota archaeon]